jgi:hypothetical protein
MIILIAIFVHFAQKKEQLLLLTFQHQSLAELIRDDFIKFSLNVWGVSAEINTVERRTSSFTAQKLMSALRRLALH